MIWFDIKNLENKISNNELTDKDGFSYVLAYTILTAIVLSLVTNNSNGLIKLLQCVISILINVWGLKSVYAVNVEKDDKDFFKRFFAINWVIGMRLIVFTLISVVIVSIIIGLFSETEIMNMKEPNTIRDIFGLIFSSIISFVCYLLIINSFRRLKTTEE